MKNQTSDVTNLYDEGLARILRVEIKDLNTGRSTFSRSEIMQVSMKRYKRMAELVIKQKELAGHYSELSSIIEQHEDTSCFCKISNTNHSGLIEKLSEMCEKLKEF